MAAHMETNYNSLKVRWVFVVVVFIYVFDHFIQVHFLIYENYFLVWLVLF